MTPSDQKFYDLVADELRARMIVDGIWVRSVAESRGDESKARAIYIGYRVEQLKAEANLDTVREAHYARLRLQEEAAKERARRERQFRALDAARLKSFDAAKFGARVGLGIFVVAWGIIAGNLLFSFSENIQLAEIGLVLFGTATTLFSLARQLPAQNVLLAGVVTALIGSGIQAIGAKAAIPFGPFLFNSNFGAKFFGVLPWTVPFIWVLVVFNSRGAVRLILRPWRKTHTYGWWVIGLTMVLCLLLDLGWEVFASRVKHYLLWNETRFPITWYGVPLVNFLGWLLTLLLILAFVTPSLINKNPARRSTPDYHPLIVWTLFNVLFIIGAAMNQLWSAAAVTGISTAAVIIFSLRGARW